MGRAASSIILLAYEIKKNGRRKIMLFRSNCIRPVYVVRGYDENDRVVAIAYAHDPNRIATVQFMLLMKYGDVVATGVAIETMRFDGWRVVG